MTTHAELAAQLLRDAADFFRHLAQDHPDMLEAMNENAAMYDEVAEMVETDPLGHLPLQDEAANDDEEME